MAINKVSSLTGLKSFPVKKNNNNFNQINTTKSITPSFKGEIPSYYYIPPMVNKSKPIITASGSDGKVDENWGIIDDRVFVYEGPASDKDMQERVQYCKSNIICNPNPKFLSNRIKNNPNKIYPIHYIKVEFDRTYGYPKSNVWLDESKESTMYIGENGNWFATLGNPNPAAVLTDLYNRGNYDDFLTFKRMFGVEDESVQKMYNSILVKKGWVDSPADSAANIKQFELNTRINPQEMAIYHLAQGDLYSAMEYGVENLPFPLNNAKAEKLDDIDIIISNRNLFARLSDDNFANKISNADSKNMPVRALNELIGADNNTDVDTKRIIVDALKVMLEAKKTNSYLTTKNVLDVYKLEEKKETAKNILAQNVLEIMKQEDAPKELLPNCVMLYGENPFIMKNLAHWAASRDGIVSQTVSYKDNNDDLQSDILEALESAEEQYQETGKYSLILVNGLDKLINPIFNSKENIATMKDLMSDASQDFHSVILFCTTDETSLDPEAMSSHRVGLKIPVDVPYMNEAEI